MARITAKVDTVVLHKSRQFVAALQKSGLSVQEAYLYGSRAKGLAHHSSDIDIAIVASNLSGDWHEDFVRLNLLAHQIDSRIEAVGYLPADFRDTSPLVWEIKTTGISLMENGTTMTSRKSSRHARTTKSTRH